MPEQRNYCGSAFLPLPFLPAVPLWCGVERKYEVKMKIRRIIDIALKAIALAMGIAVAVLSVLNKVEIKSAISMLGTKREIVA